ncbi:MAG: hypothetical protein JWR13_260 [Mycobacterium sp.]|nr:hypothetical protein [Mycobacterium sp.]MDT5312657.1 hypothetical protein [Mycobacterium sp.]
MTTTDAHVEPPAAWVTAALHAVAVAGNGLAAAKRTRSVAAIECAQREVQNAVDAARDLDVEWGQIGSALGIARGNAYQRYRKKPAVGSLQVTSGTYC